MLALGRSRSREEQAAPTADEQLQAQLQRPSPQRVVGSEAAKRPQPSSKAGDKARQQHSRDRRHGCGSKLQELGAARAPAQAAPRGSQSLTALTALGTVALYTSVRGGISMFHHLRRRYLRQLLFDLAAALNDLGQCYWLDFGSLLGIHRDGDLILHDNDVDIAVYEPDWPALLHALRAALPQYSARIVVPSDDPTTCFIRVYCPLGMADVFGATPVAGAAKGERLLVDCGHGACTEITRASVLPTGLLSWQGAKISVPGDIPAVLEERYGDWQTPKYMDKGSDVVEGQKLYARVFRALSSFGIRI